MENNTYSINHVYSIVREYYLHSFPHPLKFVSFDVINEHLKSNGSTARIEKDGVGYKLTNENPTVIKDALYDDGALNYIIGLTLSMNI